MRTVGWVAVDAHQTVQPRAITLLSNLPSMSLYQVNGTSWVSCKVS